MENYDYFSINKSINNGLSQDLYETAIDMNRNQGKLEVYIKRVSTWTLIIYNALV